MSRLARARVAARLLARALALALVGLTAKVHRRRAAQHVAARLGETQRAVTFFIGREETRREELAKHAAPLLLVELDADAERR